MILVAAMVGLTETLIKPAPVGVSALEVVGQLGVYWDFSCTKRVVSVSWGILSPGQTKKTTTYVKNEGTVPFALLCTPTAWNPSKVSSILSYVWTYDPARIDPGKVAKVTQSLRVSDNANDFSEFSFNVVFQGIDHLLGDLNLDGVVNMRDISIICSAFNATPGSPRWSPAADLNFDGIINMRDIELVAADFGKSW